ncbi:hypothetical protein FB451DRAFT_1565973 [Mycena latifolia]|nr:hypothetical protein FB451DRAFT_1565973 [Mycena latifolia]
MEQDAPIRVDDLWLADGTLLVIRAGNKMFRVVKSILEARSSVFRDMVAFPQPAGADVDTMDGSPVVRLHDSAADVEVFLRAIFDSSFFMPAPEPVDLYTVLGILRLSHKYDVQYLYRRALHHLQDPLWFSSIEAYRDRPDHPMLRWDEDEPSPLSRLLATIKAAAEVGALWLLPTAYYRATQFVSDSLPASMPSGTDQHAQKCITAGLVLSRAHTISLKFLTAASSFGGCTSPLDCSRARLRGFHWYIWDAMQGADLDPLQSWSPDEWDELSRAGMCDHCLQWSKDAHTNNIKDLWDRLPGIFDLPSWQELDDLKAAAMGEA